MEDRPASHTQPHLALRTVRAAHAPALCALFQMKPMPSAVLMSSPIWRPWALSLTGTAPEVPEERPEKGRRVGSDISWGATMLQLHPFTFTLHPPISQMGKPNLRALPGSSLFTVLASWGEHGAGRPVGPEVGLVVFTPLEHRPVCLLARRQPGRLFRQRAAGNLTTVVVFSGHAFSG